jgi:hypothetical protein
VDDTGRAFSLEPQMGLDALQALATLSAVEPRRFRLYDARERIATHRYDDLMERYLLEISEFKQENRRPERGIAIGIIRNLKGVYHYFPKEVFLELPLRELSGKGRIRWNALFLGIFPTRENHYENQFFKFNYRFELFEIQRLIKNQFEDLQRVMRETGELG